MYWHRESTALAFGGEPVDAKKPHQVLCPKSLQLISALAHLDTRPSYSWGSSNLQQLWLMGTPNFTFGELTALGVGDELVVAKKQHQVLCPKSLPHISALAHLDARSSSS